MRPGLERVDALTGLRGTEDLVQRLSSEDLHAPELLGYEIVSAVRGLVRRGALTPDRAGDDLTGFDTLPIQRWSADGALRRRAWQLRDRMPAYDAAYLALAEALECSLITRDGRLARASVHGARIEVF